MADPFVQKMMARTQARRNVVQKITGNLDENISGKENIQNFTANISVKSTNVSTTLKSEKPYKSTNLDAIKVSEDRTEIPPLQESSTNTLLSHHFPLPSSTSIKGIESNSSSSGRKQRFQHLAQRSKQLEQWEDDYTYHSVSGDSTKHKEVEISGLEMHEEGKASPKTEVAEHESTKTEHSSSELSRESSSAPLAQYYFGQHQTYKSTLEIATKPPGLHEKPLTMRTPVATSDKTPQKSFMDSSFYSAKSNFSPISPHTFTTNSVPSLRYTSPRLPKGAPSPRSTTPTRRIAWDQRLLRDLVETSDKLQKDLEAQGFTPSTSKSRLEYDFRDRSPIKDSSRSQSPDKVICPSDSSRTKNVSAEMPRIISVQSKSNVENNTEMVSSKAIQENRRDQSPTKVKSLKNQWEEHIRRLSPERQVAHCPSTSPSRIPHHKSAGALTRSPSPSRKFSASAVGGFSGSSIRSLSPAKSPHQFLPPSRQSSTTSINEFSRGGVLRTSTRSLSPHKPGPCGEVVRGDAPMPETKPVVANPLASVRERVAAFSSLTEPSEPAKDPAELSVRDRKSLFEKKKGEALVPKAPFAQCISEKTSMSGNSKPSAPLNSASKSYEAPKHTKVHVPPSNKTYACPKLQTSSEGNVQNNTNATSSSVSAHKKKFEHIEDNWRATDINSQVASQRQKEMEVLLNRFKKPPSRMPVAHPAHAQEIPVEEDSDTDYPESEVSTTTSEDNTAHMDVPLGPPKPPRVPDFLGSPVKAPSIPTAPPMPNSPHSPSKRLNSTELDESCPRSPSKTFVPKVKPGCLFPSLSDIESHSDRVDSDEETKDSSFAESVLTCASADSLGTHIQKMAQKNSSGLSKQLSTIKEGSEAKRGYDCRSMSASTLEALDAIDDALEEALEEEDDEPTPPKRHRGGEDMHGNNAYKTPKVFHHSSSSDSSESSLAHSISMYRRQKPADIPVTPVRQIVRMPDFSSPKDSPISPSVTISHRIRELQEEEEHQLTVISQASSAISVVSQHPEQHGTMQHIEAEKLLLVATQKRQAIGHEIQRLKAEGALGKRSYWSQDEESSRGSISISNITLPLKQDFINKCRDENQVYHFLVLVKHRDQVIRSQLQTTPDCVVEGAVTFPNLMALHDLTADFNISLEVYGFKIERHHPGIKKDHSRLKLTPLKRLHKESKSFSPAVSSPGGPYSIRGSSFALIGFANLNINTLTRNAWTLEKVPFSSPMTGHLLMRVSVTMEGGVSEKSFLTMFDDVGGYGAWNRRWCVLSGPFVRYWNYPDDENKKECIGRLDLRMCTTRKVEQVSRDVCARQFTFQLTFIRPLRPGDTSDLIHEIKDNTLITRILLSADSKEERILWCNKLNKALANIRAWDPDALRAEDFHV